MPYELPDRRNRLFGRADDLRYLKARARTKGLTAIVADPLMGKSWLLTEAARRLSAPEESGALVGFARQSGETPDLLLRAVVDLHERWLSDAPALEKAKKAFNQRKANLLPSAVKTLGAILQPIAGVAFGSLGEAAAGAINGLIQQDDALKAGAVQAPRLQIDDARALVQGVALVSDRPVALFLDQWEQSPNLELEAALVRAFVRDLDEWPDCHLFLALRKDEKPLSVIERLAREHRGIADLRALDRMALDDPEERSRLISYLHDRVPATQDLSASEIITLVDGYPGVVYQWDSDWNRTTMKTKADLENVAREAVAAHFSELVDLLPNLEDA